MITSDEKIIIAGIQESNSKIFESFFHEYYSALCAYSKLIVRSDDIAEDIVQELFFKIWNKKENFNISTSIKAYLYKSIYNNSIEYLRSKKREILYKEFNLKNIQSNGTSQPDFDMIEKINQAIDELPDKCGEVFKLRKFENLSHAEIAKKLDITVKTVETHIRRANIALLEKIKKLSIIEMIIILLTMLSGGKA